MSTSKPQPAQGIRKLTNAKNIATARLLTATAFATVVAVGPALVSAPAYADGHGMHPKFGRPATVAEVAAADISVAPDGKTLPAGSGSVSAGKAVYEAKCQSCHGVEGKSGEGLADPLAGGIGSLATGKPMKTVGSYWPYATTLFDYTRRAMPLNAPLTLSNDEVYAVSAYILSLNGIIADDAVMDASSLPKVEMPNRNGFTIIAK